MVSPVAHQTGRTFAMKTRTSKGLLLAALLLTGCLTPLQAQNYSIAWYKITGGRRHQHQQPVLA